MTRLVEPIIGGAGLGADPEPGDVESIDFWAYQINVAWGLLAFGCIVVTGVVAIALKKLVGDTANVVAVCVGMFAIFFCLGGCADSLYRQYVILPEARRLAARREDEAAAVQLRRSLAPNSSVFFQAAVGILAAVMVAVNV